MKGNPAAKKEVSPRVRNFQPQQDNTKNVVKESPQKDSFIGDDFLPVRFIKNSLIYLIHWFLYKLKF